jgi:hypothetical protein
MPSRKDWRRSKTKGTEPCTAIRFPLDLMRFAAAGVHITLVCPSRLPVNIGFGALPRTRYRSLPQVMASQVSPASCNDAMGKEIYLRHPPLLFNYGFDGVVHSRSHDIDGDWLPDVKDIFSGNFHVMIDMTHDSDSEVCHHFHNQQDHYETLILVAQDKAEFSSRYLQSDAGIHPITADPTPPQSSPHGKRPFWACQPPTAANSIDASQAEIPEIPGANQVHPAASGPSHGPNDRDDGGNLAATAAITEAVAGYSEEDGSVEEQQGQEKDKQQRVRTNSDGDRFPPSRQPAAPIPTFAASVLESSVISTRRKHEVVQACCTRTRAASPIMSPARAVAYTERRLCIDIQDITFLRVGG